MTEQQDEQVLLMKLVDRILHNKEEAALLFKLLSKPNNETDNNTDEYSIEYITQGLTSTLTSLLNSQNLKNEITKTTVYPLGQLAKYFNANVFQINRWIRDNRFLGYTVENGQICITGETRWKSPNGSILTVQDVINEWQANNL